MTKNDKANDNQIVINIDKDKYNFPVKTNTDDKKAEDNKNVKPKQDPKDNKNKLPKEDPKDPTKS